MCAFMKVFIPKPFACAMLSIIWPPYTEEVSHAAHFQGYLIACHLPSLGTQLRVHDAAWHANKHKSKCLAKQRTCCPLLIHTKCGGIIVSARLLALSNHVFSMSKVTSFVLRSALSGKRP
jgi:hypothetical protein